jgi:hypothetical protein
VTNDGDGDWTTSTHVDAYLRSNLTLEGLRQVLDQFQDRQAAEDADTFIRLGERQFKIYRLLRRGATVVIGGHRRGGSLGEQYLAQLVQDLPGVRAYLTDMLADGEIYLLDTNTP